jgi:hypothetical protein
MALPAHIARVSARDGSDLSALAASGAKRKRSELNSAGVARQSAEMRAQAYSLIANGDAE